MDKTTKSEIIESLAVECGISIRETWDIVGTILDTMSDALGRGESIELRGFGTFKIVNRKARKGRNPYTGEAIKIKATKAPKFSPGKALKAAVK